MTEAKTIAKGSFWTFVSNIATKLISFLYSIIIARLVSAEDIGAFYLVLSILWLLYLFTDLGLIYSFNRYVPYLYGRKEFGKLKNLLRLGYFGGGLLTLLFSGAVFFLSDVIAQMVGQPVITPILQMLSIWLVIKEIDDVSRGTLVGRKKILESSGIEVVQNFAKLILTIVAFYVVGFNSGALSAAFMLSYVLILPLGIYYVLRDMRTWEKGKSDETLGQQISLGKEVMVFGIVVSLINMMWAIIQYTDRVMLSYMTDDALEKIAIYSIALGLANLVLVFSVIASIFFPVISELYGKRDFEGMNKTLRISMKWLVMVVTPFAIIMGVFGDKFLEMFYGIFYSQGAIVLVFFVIGMFTRIIFTLPQLVLAAMRKLGVELKAVSVGAVANVALNFLFIPLWGINGAALASILSFFVVNIMIFYYSNRIFGFSFPKETYKPLLAGVFTLAVIFLLRGVVVDSIDAQIEGLQIGESQGQFFDEIAQKVGKFVMFGLLFLLSVFIYFIALLFLKSFGGEEISLLETGLRKVRMPEKYVSWSRSFLEAKWLKIPFLR